MTSHRSPAIAILLASLALLNRERSAKALPSPGIFPRQGFRCTDPTPDQPVWWKWTWTPQPDGSSTGTVPNPPPLARNLDLLRWAGRYGLTAVATGGTTHRDTITGTVVLGASTDTARARATLVGFADSTIIWPPYLTFAHSPALRGPPHYGVEVSYSRDRGVITLVFGNSAIGTNDAGVLFEVFSIDSLGIVGRWVDGGLGVLVDSAGHDLGHPQGYFCLRRMAH